jgi:hypothetical protein
LVVKVGYFFRKIIKRSPEFTILVKKYEIGDFGGSFDIFRFYLLLTFGEMDENGCEFIRKNAGNLSKDPRKPRNEFSLVRKQEMDFSGIF